MKKKEEEKKFKNYPFLFKVLVIEFVVFLILGIFNAALFLLSCLIFN